MQINKEETIKEKWFALIFIYLFGGYFIYRAFYYDYFNLLLLTTGLFFITLVTLHTFKKRVKNYMAYMLFAVSVQIFITIIHVAHNRDTNIEQSHLIKLNGTIDEISKHDNYRQDDTYRLCLTEFPNYIFETASIDYDRIAQDQQLRKGETISMFIKKNDFEKKISGNEPATILDKLIDWNFIKIFSLETNEKTILKLNLTSYSESTPILLFIISMIFILSAILMIFIGVGIIISN